MIDGLRKQSTADRLTDVVVSPDWRAYILRIQCVEILPA